MSLLRSSFRLCRASFLAHHPDITATAILLRSIRHFVIQRRKFFSTKRLATARDFSFRDDILRCIFCIAVAAADRSLAVGVYANAFEPVSVRGAANEVVSAHRADLEQGRWPLFVNDWLLAGATIVGGCCGVMPRHLAEIRGTVDRFLADRPS